MRRPYVQAGDDGDGDGDDLPVFFRRAVKREPEPEPAAAAVSNIRPVLAKRNKKTVTFVQEDAPPPPEPEPTPTQLIDFRKIDAEIPDSLYESLSSYDKPARAIAPREKRLDVLGTRIKRSKEKISALGDVDIETATVDDSLMLDASATMASDYQRHVEFKGSDRVLVQPSSMIKKRSREVPQPRKDDDKGKEEYDADDEEAQRDQEEDGDDSRPIYADPIYPDDAEPRALVAPMRRVPDDAARKTIKTFTEYAAPSPATKQFQANMRHVKGREQGIHMVVRDAPEIYQVVGETLRAPLANQFIAHYAMRHGLVIPDLPLVTKAEVRDGLWAPNLAIGERACVYQERCTSLLMCADNKKRDPGRYANAQPFVCKEFFYGAKAEEVRDAIARGINLNEVLMNTPLHLCILCILSTVSAWFKRFDADVANDPPHILHAFKMPFDIPGGYPHNKKLPMDGKKFCGVIASFLRFSFDNYVWVPNDETTLERDPSTGGMRRVPMDKNALPHWDETEDMDF